MLPNILWLNEILIWDIVFDVEIFTSLAKYQYQDSNPDVESF